MVALTGLTAAGFTGPYNVLVYGVGDANGGRSGDYTLGSQSFRMVDDQQFNGTFRQATAPGGSGTGQSANYVLFAGVTGDSFVVTAQATQDLMGFRAPINGIQIIRPRNVCFSLSYRVATRRNCLSLANSRSTPFRSRYGSGSNGAGGRPAIWFPRSGPRSLHAVDPAAGRRSDNEGTVTYESLQQTTPVTDRGLSPRTGATARYSASPLNSVRSTDCHPN
jgi:hypothetical protein